MRIAVVGTKGGWSSEYLADAVADVTDERVIVEMDRVRLDLPSGAATFEGRNLAEFDALIVKKIGSRYSPDLLDRLEILRFLESRGLPVFSSAEKILRVLDRLSCTVTLQLASIPMPPTTITEDVDHAVAALAEYGEAVFKPLYTSKGRGMFVLRNEPEARRIIEDYHREYTILYIQKTIDLKDKDLGVVFLGGEYLTTYARRKEGGAWNTSTALGGKYVPFDPPKEIIDLAHRAQEPFGLDFTCVDVALTDEGPFVFEVSAFGGFRGILQARNIDAAAALRDYVIGRLAA